MRRWIGAACVGLVLAGCSGGMLGAGAKTYTFEIKPKQGQTFNYDMTMTGAANATMIISMTADKVENGQTTFRSKMNMSTMNGQAIPPALTQMMNQMTIVQVMDKTGKVLSQNIEGMPQGMQAPQQSSVTVAAFPDHPVKVGDTWTATTKNATATYKFVSVGNENGKEIANFEVTMGESAQLKPDGPAHISVETETGMPTSMNVSGTTSNGQKMSVSMKRTN